MEDIREQGLLHPIMMFEEKILDGRNRFRACKKAGVEPEFKAYRGKDPIGYVISANVRHRHLTESQRAMVAARLATLKLGANQYTGGSANLPTQAEAAEKLSVSERTVRSARAILDSGVPDLAKAVDEGKLTVSAGAKVAKLPEKQAQKAAEAIRGGAKPSSVLPKSPPKASRVDVDREPESSPAAHNGQDLVPSDWSRNDFLDDISNQIHIWFATWREHEPNCKLLAAKLRASAGLEENFDENARRVG